MHRHPRVVLTITIMIPMWACGPELDGAGEPVETSSTREDDDAAWREYLALAVPYNGGFLVEGDLRFRDEASLREYYLRRYGEHGQGLAVVPDGNGVMSIWSQPAKRRIDYCFDNSFGALRGRAEAAVHEAAAAWEAKVDVNFFHNKSQDGASCTIYNAIVDFNVRFVDDGDFYASAFFPHDFREDRELILDQSVFELAVPETLNLTMKHELGHALGFMHEFVRCSVSSGYFPLTSLDPWSVMNYYNSGCGFPIGERHLSPRDVQGAVRIYGEAKSTDRLLGDFNGDQRTDVAMWRNGWASIPVYFSNADGSFSTTNFGLSNNLINSQPDATKLVGDFDGDGRSDILVADDSQGSNVTVYYSQSNGTFDIRTVAQTTGDLNDYEASKIVGRFDNVAGDDILVWKTGRATSTTILARGRSTPFAVVTAFLSGGQVWLNDPNANRLPGDYDGDGKTDIALWKEGWNSTPVYFSDGSGTFIIRNVDHLSFENWINDPASSKIVGRFAAGARDGILLWRPDWNTGPVYFSDSTPSNRTGTFTKTNLSAGSINNEAKTRIPGDFDGDGLTDLMMVTPSSQVVTILFSEGNGSMTEQVMAITGQSGSGTEFPFVTIESAIPLVGRFDANDRSDVLLWKSEFASNPIMYGYSRSIVGASNRADPFANLLNAR